MAKKTEETSKKKINGQAMLDTVLSYVSFAILAGLAFFGVQSLVEGSEAVATAVAGLVVVLLTKTALNK